MDSCGAGLTATAQPGQAKKQLPAAARAPAVETKRELVEVVVQMFVSDGAMVRAEEPSLEQRTRPELNAKQESHPVVYSTAKSAMRNCCGVQRVPSPKTLRRRLGVGLGFGAGTAAEFRR